MITSAQAGEQERERGGGIYMIPGGGNNIYIKAQRCEKATDLPRSVLLLCGKANI